MGYYNQDLFGYKEFDKSRTINCLICSKTIPQKETSMRVPRMWHETSRGCHTICYIIAMKSALNILENKGLSIQQLE
jgi:hypothetical protein